VDGFEMDVVAIRAGSRVPALRTSKRGFHEEVGADGGFST